MSCLLLSTGGNENSFPSIGNVIGTEPITVGQSKIEIIPLT